MTNAEEHGLSKADAAKVWNDPKTSLVYGDRLGLDEYLLEELAGIERPAGQLKILEAFEQLASDAGSGVPFSSKVPHLTLFVPKALPTQEVVGFALHILGEVDAGLRAGEIPVAAETGLLGKINDYMRTRLDGEKLNVEGKVDAADGYARAGLHAARRAHAPLSPNLENKAMELGLPLPGVPVRGYGLSGLRLTQNYEALDSMRPRLISWREGRNYIETPEFQEAIEKMVDEYYPMVIKSGVSPTNTTVRQNIRDVRSFLEWLENQHPGVPLGGVTRAHIESFLKEGRTELDGGTGVPREIGIAASRGGHAVSALRVFFSGLAHEPNTTITDNPALRAKKAQTGAGRPYEWTTLRIGNVMNAFTAINESYFPPAWKPESADARNQRLAEAPDHLRAYVGKLVKRVPASAKRAGVETEWIRAENLRMANMTVFMILGMERPSDLAFISTQRLDDAVQAVEIGIGKADGSNLWGSGKAGDSNNMGIVPLLNGPEQNLFNAYLEARPILMAHPTEQVQAILDKYTKLLKGSKGGEFDPGHWLNTNLFFEISTEMRGKTGGPENSIAAETLLPFFRAATGDIDASTNLKPFGVQEWWKHVDLDRLALWSGTTPEVLGGSYGADLAPSLDLPPTPGTKK
jgi:hypothetical protein